MTTPTALQPAQNVVTPGVHAVARAGQWTQREAELIANVIARGLTPVELSAFAAVCRHTQLDPFRRQIYAIKRGGVMGIQVAIDGYRSIAARSGDYMGQIGPEWCGPDGDWRDVWTSDTPPAAARVGVRRRGWDEPVFATVTYREFRQETTTWKAMPAHMLAVRAESHALRRAFPETFADLEATASAAAGMSVTVEAVDAIEVPQIEPAHAGEDRAESGEEAPPTRASADQEPSPAPDLETFYDALLEAAGRAKLGIMDICPYLNVRNQPDEIHAAMAERGLDIPGLLRAVKGATTNR